MADNDIGRHGYAGEVPSAANRSREPFKDVAVGEVLLVRPESLTMDIELRDGGGILSDVRITMPSSGRLVSIGAMPEVGSIVVLIKGNGRLYYPVAYLPADPIGGKSYRVIKKASKGELDGLANSSRIMPSRIRELSEGDAIVASGKGSCLMLDKEVELSDSMGNELRIRPGDGAMVATSRNNFMFSHGVWRSAGLIQRNSVEGSPDGSRRVDLEASEVHLSDGRKATFIGGDFLRYGSELYSEYRVEVDDHDVLHHPTNDINSTGNLRSDQSSRRSSFVLGNYVGNDPSDVASYGKFLSPKFLSGTALRDSAYRFAPLGRNAGSEVEYDTKGLSWALEYRGKSFLGSDKEGSIHRYMSSGTGPDNAGWSMTSVATGARRDVLGKEPGLGLSWKALMHGGMDWDIGRTTGSPIRGELPYGLRLRSSGPALLSFGDDQSDFSNMTSFASGSPALGRSELIRYGLVERVKGSRRDEVTGDCELRVGGDYLWEIAGKFSYRIGGSFGESVFGDRTISTTAAFSVNSSEVRTMTGSRTTKVVAGGDDTKILKGDSTTSIGLGSKSTSLLVGSIKESIGTGDRKSSIAAGNFSVSIAAGSSSITSKAGNMEYTTAAGVAVIGGVCCTLRGSAAVKVESPLVSLGQGVLSGVVTMLSHQDYVTGLPLRPSLTVLAAV